MTTLSISVISAEALESDLLNLEQITARITLLYLYSLTTRNISLRALCRRFESCRPD